MSRRRNCENTAGADRVEGEQRRRVEPFLPLLFASGITVSTKVTADGINKLLVIDTDLVEQFLV